MLSALIPAILLSIPAVQDLAQREVSSDLIILAGIAGAIGVPVFREPGIGLWLDAVIVAAFLAVTVATGAGEADPIAIVAVLPIQVSPFVPTLLVALPIALVVSQAVNHFQKKEGSPLVFGLWVSSLVILILSVVRTL